MFFFDLSSDFSSYSDLLSCIFATYILFKHTFNYNINKLQIASLILESYMLQGFIKKKLRYYYIALGRDISDFALQKTTLILI